MKSMGKNTKRKRRIVAEAVKSGITDVPEISEILSREGLKSSPTWIRRRVERLLARRKPRSSVNPREVQPTPEQLQYVIQTPMEHLRFRDFMELKCGWDEYSKLRLPALREMAPEHELVDVVLEENERQIAACLRWMLRGLPIDKAIRKVQTDEEVARNAIGIKRQGWNVSW
jgi:hypothetical protein